MHILITGASGFVGGHLAEHLTTTQPAAQLHGTTRSAARTTSADVQFHTIDLTDPQAVVVLLREIQPTYIYHLAAQAFVPQSFKHPWESLETNIRAQLNLILACLELGLTPRMLVVSSAEIYGGIRPEDLPVTEKTPLRPTSPYSVSKVAQDLLAYQYHLSHQLPLIRARPFNHIGPRQSERFVAPAFAMQVARIEAGRQKPVLFVGNLSAQRDFTDVRDVVRAYQMIAEQGEAGAVYNVASGQVHTAQQIVDTLLAQTDVTIEVRVDPERLRPVSIPVIAGSAERLRQVTGWAPQISFSQSLKDILTDCRQRARNETQN